MDLKTSHQDALIPTRLTESEIKNHPVVSKGGFYLFEIVSAYEYLNKKGRRIFKVVVKTVDDLYAWFYLTIYTAKGRVRKADMKKLEDLQVVSDIIELSPKEGLGAYYFYKERMLSYKEQSATYPDLVGKKFIGEISASRDYDRYFIQMNYTLLNIYHPTTFQTADEILENFSFEKPKPVGLLGVVESLDTLLKSVDLRELKQGIKGAIRELVRLEIERR